MFPIELKAKLSTAKVLFPSSALANAAAPLGPILLPPKLSSVKVLFSSSALANAAAPLGPILNYTLN